MSTRVESNGDVVIRTDMVEKYQQNAESILGWALNDRDIKKAEVWAYMARTEAIRRSPDIVG